MIKNKMIIRIYFCLSLHLIFSYLLKYEKRRSVKINYNLIFRITKWTFLIKKVIIKSCLRV